MTVSSKYCKARNSGPLQVDWSLDVHLSLISQDDWIVLVLCEMTFQFL